VGAAIEEHKFADGAADEGASAEDANGAIVGRGGMRIQLGEGAGKWFELIKIWRAQLA
jgi:hypothetical protein